MSERIFKDVVSDMARVNAEQKIKVGSIGGSGFFWVGTAGELTESFDKLDEQAKINSDYSVVYTEGKLRQCEKKLEEWEESEREKLEKASESAKGYYARTVERNKEFQYPSLRKVVDMFKAAKVIDDAYIIMVDGYENGKYWTFEERVKAGNNPIGLRMNRAGK